MKKYGIDAYSRYVEDGSDERLCVERWPFWRKEYLLSDFYSHIIARYHVICWHIGMIRQHGIATWWEDRKL